jgi:hypothetical protein
MSPNVRESLRKKIYDVGRSILFDITTKMIVGSKNNNVP